MRFFVVAMAAACGPVPAPTGRDLSKLTTPIISRELATEAPFADANAFGAAAPAVSFGRGVYLIAWVDQQRPNSSQVFTERVAADGTVLDEAPTVISTGRFGVRDVDIAFDGTNFLVVWSQGALHEYFEQDLWAARISPDGAVLDPRGIPIASVSGTDHLHPRVAFNGANYVIAWTATIVDGAVRAARVTPGGVVLDAVPIDLSSTAPSDGRVDVAAMGSTSVVVWTDTRQSAAGDIRAARITAAGTVLDVGGVVVCNSAGEQRDPAIACTASQCLVAWTDATTNPPRPLVARLDAAGAVLDANGVTVPGTLTERTALSLDGADFLLSFSEVRDGFDTIVFDRITSSATAVDATPRVVHPAVANQHTQAAAFGASESMVVWADERAPGGATIYGKRVAQGGDAVGTRLALSNREESFIGENMQLSPSAAFDGTHVFVVWSGWKRGLIGARFSLSGDLLDPSGITVTSAPVDKPTLAWGGTNFQTTWTEVVAGVHQVLAARVSPDGTVLDARAVQLMPDAGINNRALGAGCDE